MSKPKSAQKYGLEQTDLQGPLAQFQVTKFVKEDIRKLFFTINNAAGEQKLSDTVAITVFEKWWPDLEAQISKIDVSHQTTRPTSDVRSDRDLLEELLLLTRKVADEQTKGNTTTRPKPAPAATTFVKYEDTLFKALMDLASHFFSYGGFDSEELEDLKKQVDELSVSIPTRNLSNDSKIGLGRELSELSAKIEKILRNNSDQQT